VPTAAATGTPPAAPGSSCTRPPRRTCPTAREPDDVRVRCAPPARVPGAPGVVHLRHACGPPTAAAPAAREG